MLLQLRDFAPESCGLIFKRNAASVVLCALCKCLVALLLYMLQQHDLYLRENIWYQGTILGVSWCPPLLWQQEAS